MNTRVTARRTQCDPVVDTNSANSCVTIYRGSSVQSDVTRDRQCADRQRRFTLSYDRLVRVTAELLIHVSACDRGSYVFPFATQLAYLINDGTEVSRERCSCVTLLSVHVSPTQANESLRSIHLRPNSTRKSCSPSEVQICHQYPKTTSLLQQ